MRRQFTRWLIAAAALVAVVGCNETKDESNGSKGGGGIFAKRIDLPAGATLNVRLQDGINSEHASSGDAWSGTVTRAVTDGDRVVIAEGASVRGVVTRANPAAKGSRAMIDLAVREVSVDGKMRDVSAGTEAIIAGSTRARNLGAIAGGIAGGALIGKAIGGDGKDAAVGGLIGGAAATGAVAASKGYQVVLKPGTVIQFTIQSDATS
jgi:hypothetical protein